MGDQRQILTDKNIARLPFASEKQYKVRDSELPGFFVLIGKRRKSFIAQGEFWRDGVREFAAQVKLGDFGVMTTREARGKAKEALGAIARGQRPGEAPKIKPGSITLGQAWDRYRDAHMERKGRIPADSETGHLVEHKEDRDLLSKWGNDLRQSYRTLAQAAGVSELDIHLLMNHSLPGVNAGYITRDRLLRDHLRQQQQRISELVVHSVALKRDPLLVRWLRSERRVDAESQSDTISMAA